MSLKKRELIIVGGGPAGMAAALAAAESGVRQILLLERDQYLGGILNQCVHTGFGLEYFKEQLTGPEYADRFIDRIRAERGIEVSVKSFVLKVASDKTVTFLKPGKLEEVRAQALIMATGCRERTREMVHIAGSRPAGVFSAGLAQKLINIEGFLPGHEAVIVGSGDIGLIMARRLTLEGCRVNAIVEVRPSSRGLARNVAQCVDDFGIPMYFKHRIKAIFGRNRVKNVVVVPVDDAGKDLPGAFTIDCDTVLISVGLIPENELMEMAGVALDRKTNSPVSETVNRTSVPGIFACGNSFKVYDLVDSVTTDSLACGKMAAEYIRSNR